MAGNFNASPEACMAVDIYSDAFVISNNGISRFQLLFLGEKNPGISYEFSVPKSVTNIPERTRFSWRTGEFDKCSKTCAGGETYL